MLSMFNTVPDTMIVEVCLSTDRLVRVPSCLSSLSSFQYRSDFIGEVTRNRGGERRHRESPNWSHFNATTERTPPKETNKQRWTTPTIH
jgi:hypothetical protein